MPPRPAASSSPLPGLARRSAAEALAALEHAAAEYAERPSGEALHAVRVALRRLAALASLFHGFPEKHDGAAIEEAADELRRALSPSREREVSTSLVHRLSGEDTEPTREALAALKLDAAGDVPEIAARLPGVLADLAGWNGGLSAWAPVREDEERLERKLKKRLKSARRRVLDVGVPGPRTLHRLRIAGKSLRYALELVGGVAPAAAELVKASKKFQDALGDANDWAALHRTLRDARASAPRASRATLDRLAPVVEEERARAFDQAQRETRRFQTLLGGTKLRLEIPRGRVVRARSRVRRP